MVDYRTYKDGVEDTYSTYQYFENNKQWFSDVDGSQTTNTFDKSGRQTNMKLVDGGSTYNYSYSYYADGREKAVTANGDAKGSSSFSYDANENKVRVDKGNGDGQDRNQYSTFMYNNENQIVYKWADDGESANREKVEYAYANGNPVGETGTDMDGVQSTKLDTGNYSTVKNFGDEFPNTSVTLYTVNQGDTLQSIASSMYGNPSLWFVIAEANGLNGTEELKAGSKLQVPNTIQNGSLTGEAHATYKEGDIIGSSLPNLVSPPPPSSGGGCGAIIMIIIVVVIAVYSAGALSGVAANIAGTLFAGAAATTVTASVISYALAGAFVYAVGNIVQQGLFIALGYQDSFEWGQVGDAAVSGLFTGAAAGIASAGTTAAKVGEATKLASSTAKIAAAAVKVAGAAVSQYMKNGEITSWTSIAVAALGQTDTGAVDSAKNAIVLAGTVGSEVLNYVSPWLQLAETYVRNDGELKPADWANAVTGTITNAINTTGGLSDNQQLGYRLLTNAIVGGALAQTDKLAAESYFANSIGNEIGTLMGREMSKAFNEPTQLIRGVSEQEAARIAYEREGDALFAAVDRDFARTTEGNQGDVPLGKKTPTMFASLNDGTMTDAGPQNGPLQVAAASNVQLTDENGVPYTQEQIDAAIRAGFADAKVDNGNFTITDDLAGVRVDETRPSGLDVVRDIYALGADATEEQIMQLQQVLSDFGYNLGDFGENANGIDGLIGGANSRTQRATRSFISTEERGAQYNAIIRESAEKYGIQPEMLKAVLRAESAFKADAYNSQAEGIAQFTAATAVEYGLSVNTPAEPRNIKGEPTYDKSRPQFAGEYDPFQPLIDERRDPAKAIDASAKYLSTLISRFPEGRSADDTSKFALAAYNSGPQTVNNALIAYGKQFDLNTPTSRRGQVNSNEILGFYMEKSTLNPKGQSILVKPGQPVSNTKQTYDYVNKIYGFGVNAEGLTGAYVKYGL